MRPDTLLSYVRAAPFAPFRIVLNSGRAWDVRHPEMVRVGRDVFHYYYAEPPEGPFSRWDTVSLLLIERIERLGATGSAGGDAPKTDEANGKEST
jgi:hypothetical protein